MSASDFTLSAAYRASLLALVDQYRQRAGGSDSSVSRKAASGDSMFVSKLRAGDSVTLGKAEALEVWLRAHTPKADEAA